MKLLKELYEQHIKEANISKETAHKVYHADYIRKKQKKKTKK